MAPDAHASGRPPDGPADEASGRRLLRAAAVVSVALFALRLSVGEGIGFGDAEALYACYALHPQPAYLDHPGLIGWLGGLIGKGEAPEPRAAHLLTAGLATLVPWLAAGAARAAGASPEGAWKTVIALTLCPVMAIGLFALTPDLLLSVFWLCALGFACLALGSSENSFRALLFTLAAAISAAAACLSKLSGVLLVLSLFAPLLHHATRSRWRSVAPWAGLAIFVLLVSPLVLWEARRGFPMLVHRLISTQAGAGFSLRNVGALLGGQLLYITPPFLWVAALVLRDLYRRRNEDAVSALLLAACVVPGALLGLLCLWSRVAEPHWLAPAYLSLALHYARNPGVISRAIAKSSLALGAVAAALAWLLVQTPLLPKLLGSSYEPRYDLTNDLHAWGPGRALVTLAVEQTMLDSGRLPVVVGPHWTVCAQVHAALGARAPVGCNSPIRDDFDDWLPRARWLQAPVVLWVDDSRFPQRDPAIELPGRSVRAIVKTDVRRGRFVVRTIRVVRLDRVSDVAESQSSAAPDGRPAAGVAWSPAARISSESSSGPGLGVVSRRSP